MRKLIAACLMIITVLLSACHTPQASTILREAPPAPTAHLSRFFLVRLMPTALPSSLMKMTASKKSAAQLDRELVIRLSKCLTQQKIVPANNKIAKPMLNINPTFKVKGSALILEVTFEDSSTTDIITMRTFYVENTWAEGFKNSPRDRISLADLAQQVVNFIHRSQ